LTDLLDFLRELHAKGDGLFLHQQGLDTSSPSGQAMFQIMGVFAEFERAMIRERMLAGLARAKEQGISLGRRRLEDSDPAKVVAIRRLWQQNEECGGLLGIYRPALARFSALKLKWRHGEHAWVGVKISGCWNGTDLKIARHAPRVGEHSLAVLKEARLAADQIEAVIRSGATID
jgi:DNA invertase Pin-like site-specific DNA recombinase